MAEHKGEGTSQGLGAAARPPVLRLPGRWPKALGCGCGLLALVLGVLVLGFTAWQIQVGNDFADRAIAVPGEVVRVHEQTGRSGAGRYGRRGSTSNISTIRYTDKAGSPHQLQERKSESSGTREPGDVVTVLYNPDDPTDAVVDDYLGRHAGSAAGLLFGLFFAALGAVFLFLVYRHRQREKAGKARAATHESIAD